MKKTNIYLLGIFIALFIGTTIVYFPSLQGTFILDDFAWIQPMTLSQIKHIFVGSWEHGNTLRPIMRLQFLSSRILFGENPFWWHMVNIFLHALVAYATYLITRTITKKEWLSFLTASLFAIYPTNHEVVAWISGRTHSFGLLLSLAAGIFIYRSFLLSRHQWFNGIVGFLFLFNAFLSYEISFAIPFGLIAAISIIGPRTKKSWSLSLGSLAVLGILIAYRYQVLGSIGSVGTHHSNIFLAPFKNFQAVTTLFLYTKELKLSIALLFTFLLYILFLHKIWKGWPEKFKAGILFFSLTVISYLPFVIVKGVAPRFLYTSLFFFFLCIAILYDVAEPYISKKTRIGLAVLMVIILIASSVRTWQVSNKYKLVSDAYINITETLKMDYPTWPKGRDVLYYNIPGKYENILAFLTYFEKAVKYGYHGNLSGRVYRADYLSSEELKKILEKKPIIYEFIGFKKGIERLVP